MSQADSQAITIIGMAAGCMIVIEQQKVISSPEFKRSFHAARNAINQCARTWRERYLTEKDQESSAGWIFEIDKRLDESHIDPPIRSLVTLAQFCITDLYERVGRPKQALLEPLFDYLSELDGFFSKTNHGDDHVEWAIGAIEIVKDVIGFG